MPALPKPEWVPIEELFARLTGLSEHAKQVIRHWLGPELTKADVDKIVKFIRDAEALNHVMWHIGCYVMCVWTEGQSHDFDWDQLDIAHVERIERVAELLLSATVIAT